MIPFVDETHTGSELATLQGVLDNQRALMLWKLEGVDEEQARSSPVGSATSLLGLVKHLAWVERWWFCDFIGGQEQDYPWSDDDPDADWRIEDDESVQTISQLYVDAVAAANEVIAEAESLDVTSEHGGRPRSLRWVMVHMIEETARHAGHADIVREIIDGTVGYYPDN